MTQLTAPRRGFLNMPRLPVSGFLIRLVAFIFDLLVVIAAIHLFSKSFPDFFWMLGANAGYVSAGFTFAYFALFNGPFGKGQTIGKMVLGITVTDLDGRITGAHRTWLAPDGSGKAPVDPPRKAMGDLLGHAVRFGDVRDVMAAGEGIETILSLRQALPTMPMVSALSAGHLAAILFPPHLRRLYIVRDNDPAGDSARDSLVDRAHEVGIETITLSPMMGDFNEDLTTHGLDAVRTEIRVQIAPEDVSRFMASIA